MAKALQAESLDEATDAREQEATEIAETMDSESEYDAAEEIEQPEADGKTEADRHHEERITEASQAVADAAVQLSRAQAAAKVAKKHFGVAVEELEGIINRGPERMPLFDAANGQSVKSVGKTPTYDPPLEEGQCRVRITALNPELNGNDVPDVCVPGAVLIMRALKAINLQNPEMMMMTANKVDDMALLAEEDDYEILEHWPRGAEEPTVFAPPLRFGPNKPEPVEEAPPETDDWRREPIEALLLAKGTVAKLREAGLATVGKLSDRMGPGGPWWRGIDGVGQAAAEKIAEAFEKFWKQHPEAVA